MNLEPFTGPGSTPSRRRFWDKVTAYVIAAQKVAGRNVSVAEHQGKGTLINSTRGYGAKGVLGACCVDGVCSVTTEPDCEGEWQGAGTVCDPNPCVVCTNCDFLFPPLGPSEDICYRVENCDGFAEPVPCESVWYTKTEYCVGEAVDCSEICIVQTIDPVTCEIVTVEGSEEACAACVNGTVQSLSDQATICTGACCIDGICSIETEVNCVGSFGFYQGDGTTCDPDPC